MIKFLILFTLFSSLTTYANEKLICNAKLNYEIVTADEVNLEKEAGSVEYDLRSEEKSATFSEGFNVFNKDEMLATDLLVNLDIITEQGLNLAGIDVSSGYYTLFSSGYIPLLNQYGLYFKIATSNTPNSSEKLIIECYLE